MPYATGRTFLDADSHIIELPGFLREHADPTIRDRMPEVSPSSGGRMADAVERLGPDGGHSPERVADLLDLGDGLIAGPKGYEALGACNAVERGRALDLLGFHRQLVFATFSPGVLFDPNGPPDVTAAASAHNRAMATFCSSDERLLGVGATALDDVSTAMAELGRIIDLGLGAVWIPHRPAGGRSPGHDDLDPFWAALADSGLPAVLHVGGAPLQLPPEWLDTGRPLPTDWLGGGENVRGKDIIALHHAAEAFVGALVLTESSNVVATCGSVSSSSVRAGCPPCCGGSIRSPTSGSARSPSWQP